MVRETEERDPGSSIREIKDLENHANQSIWFGLACELTSPACLGKHDSLSLETAAAGEGREVAQAGNCVWKTLLESF